MMCVFFMRKVHVFLQASLAHHELKCSYSSAKGMPPSDAYFNNVVISAMTTHVEVHGQHDLCVLFFASFAD